MSPSRLTRAWQRELLEVSVANPGAEPLTVYRVRLKFDMTGKTTDLDVDERLDARGHITVRIEARPIIEVVVRSEYDWFERHLPFFTRVGLVVYASGSRRAESIGLTAKQIFRFAGRTPP